MSELGWGRCPLGCAPVPGYVVPFPPGERFPLGVAVKTGIHPSRYGGDMPCIGSRQITPPLPISMPPTAAEGLALEREALASGKLF